MWDFRNESARQYLAAQVAGYFARAQGVDGVFFDEGDSFACHYSCRSHNTCKTMPSAKEWQAGAIQAWRLAAEEMARAGKHAIISSQNSFAASTPYLMKTQSCPVSEDAAFAAMNSSSLARKGWARFYEYFAHPGDQHTVAANALYCANSIRNAAREAELGVPFIAAASNYPWGTPGRGPSPSPHRPPSPPCDSYRSQPACPPQRCIWDSCARRWPLLGCLFIWTGIHLSRARSGPEIEGANAPRQVHLRPSPASAERHHGVPSHRMQPSKRPVGVEQPTGGIRACLGGARGLGTADGELAQLPARRYPQR
jgi:hypothetical protein